MEAFANKFTRDNPKVFSDQGMMIDFLLLNFEDAAYLLAFSIIMLNTDAHNPNIKKERKITMEEWIRNSKGVNGADLPGKGSLECTHLLCRRISTKDLPPDC